MQKMNREIEVNRNSVKDDERVDGKEVEDDQIKDDKPEDEKCLA